MATIFSRIIKGEIPCHKVAENEEFFAFLDIRPRMQGHTLVVSKEEVDELFAIDKEQLGRMMQFAQTVAKAIKATVPCNRVGMMVVGLEVPHAHMHLIPITKLADISLEKEPLTLSSEQLADVAAGIRNNLK